MANRVKRANVVKRANSPYWYGRFMVGGKACWVSTKTEVKKDADAFVKRKIAADRKTLSLDECWSDLTRAIDTLPKDATTTTETAGQFLSKAEKLIIKLAGMMPKPDEVLNDAAKRIASAKGLKINVADAWKAWQVAPDKKRHPSKNTEASYKGIWKRFETWAALNGVTYLHDVDDAKSLEYMRYVEGVGVSNRTLNGHKVFLGSVWNALKTEGSLIDNPWRKRVTKELATEGRESFTKAELDVMWEKASPTMRVMIAVGLFTGLRLSDVVTMRWVNIKNGVITVIPHKTAKTKQKSDKKVEIPVIPELARYLADYRMTSKGEYLFPDEMAAFKHDRTSASQKFQAFLEDDCKFTTTRDKTEGDNRKRRSVVKGFHSLRYSFVTAAAASGIPQHVIQKMVGHGSPAITEHYTEVSPDSKKLEMGKLNLTLE
ncbi:MAG: tyrosine-type recombinase/integrase [bacterium]